MNHAKAIDDLITQLGGSYANADYRGFDPAATESNAELTALKDRNVFLTSSVLGMKAISNVIEDQAIALNKPVGFYAAFQQFSRIRVQLRRYSSLLDNGCTVHLFGERDTDTIPTSFWRRSNLKLGPLPSVPPGEKGPHLNSNWLVVLHDPTFVSIALVTREIPNPFRPLNAANKLIYRSFEGFWTYDKEVITYVVRVLDDYIATASVAASPVTV